MNLPRLSVHRPYLVWMSLLGVLLLSLVAITKLPVELLPEMEPPVVSVLVPYPGASAEDVESDVIKYLEDQLSTVEGLDKLFSVAKDNLALVTCQFEWGTDLDSAVNDVRDKLDLARWDISQHAPSAEEPIIFRFSSATAPVMVVSLSSDSSWRDLYRMVDANVLDDLRRIEGVGAVVVYGGLRREIKVRLDADKLQAYGIDPRLVAHRLREENLDLPLGKIKKGRRSYFIRIKARFTSPKEIGDVLLTVRKGKPVYLRDVAEVKDDFEEEQMLGFANGKPAVVLVVKKRSGANTVKVCKRIRERLGELKGLLPSDTKVNILMDASEFIFMAIRDLLNTVVIAGILVVLITFLFLRRVRSSLVVALSIPFSLLGSFVFLYLFHYSINIMSLMSLAIAIGMVVDNSIVVLESVTRKVSEGVSPDKASEVGAGEVGGAIFASTLTTICVFIPLIFVKGLTGIMFKQLGFTVSATITFSWLIALTLVPFLTSRILRSDGRRDREVVFARVEEIYAIWLERALNSPKKVLGFAVVLFVSSLFLAKVVGTSFFPKVDTGDITITYFLSEASRVEETARVTQRIGEIVRQVVRPRELRGWYAFVGQSKKGIGSAMGFPEGENVGEIGVKLVPRKERSRSGEEIAYRIRQRLREIPDLEKFQCIAITPVKRMLLWGRSEVEVELLGHDLKELRRYAKALEEGMKKIPGAVNVKTSVREPRLELRVKVDREKLATLGLSVKDVAEALRLYLHPDDVVKFRDAGEDFDVTVALPEKQRYSFDYLYRLPLVLPSGKVIPLREVAEVEFSSGEVEVRRKDRQRVVTVGCDTYHRPLSEVKRDVDGIIRSLHLPPSIRVEFGGQIDEQKKAFSELKGMLLLGMALVYMVLTGQFESLKAPLVIFFSVPFAVVGVIVGLLLVGMPFSMMGFMALIMLTGVVVNNAIVMVDYIKILRLQGMDVRTAVVSSARRRLRPILMTWFTTVLGMLPLALGMGEGAEIWKEFGVAAIGGLMFSGTITLFLVPVMYTLLFHQPTK